MNERIRKINISREYKNCTKKIRTELENKILELEGRKVRIASEASNVGRDIETTVVTSLEYSFNIYKNTTKKRLLNFKRQICKQENSVSSVT